ncbi:response regulator [Thioclava dalianensis]|uniref:Response regulator n=1 Tax=Thioclava dalianensis TaxID=1185766 RepID=A0A074TEG1_9RHOB|nr:response regulator [Thioclava dalianensis]KEP70141.1 response regulator [Thioclava dalianensis]SFM80249.1 Response regulator receiver domain-containing protein [Thioclava dalianensis]
MTDDLPKLQVVRKPTAERPLLGLTVLLVEDSRHASEAVRLLCLRSGARIRRADRLASAYRHLQTYRPSVVIVDIGLPDGSGDGLIAELAKMKPRVPVILGTSGDTALRENALEAGADGFLEKPVESLAHFQQAILSSLPASERPQGPRTLTDPVIEPDPIALRDDLFHMAEVLREGPNSKAMPYAAHFLAGIALTAHDQALRDAAKRLARAGGPSREDYTMVRGLVAARLASSAAI